jgi:hypothetical protein
VVVLLVVVVVAAVPVLYAADRVMKARAHTRRLRNMTDRLAAATARTDEQQEKQQAVVRASAELTSVMPAIKRPPLTLPDEPSPDEPSPDEPSPAAAPRTAARPRTGRGRTGPDHGPAHPRRSAPSGEHPVRPADRAGQH